MRYPSFERPDNRPSDDPASDEETKKHHRKPEDEKDKANEAPQPKPKKADKKEKKPPQTPADKKEKDKKESTPKPTPEQQQAKRTEIVERSLHYTKHYEGMPIPRDPATLAKLLVAEHILALNDQIAHPTDIPDAPGKAALLAAFDHMGQLAEKLEYPDVEAPPDIEEAYESILQLAENSLDEGEDIAIIVATNSYAARLTNDADLQAFVETAQPNATPGRDRPQPPGLSTTVAALTTAVVHARQQGAAPANTSPSDWHDSSNPLPSSARHTTTSTFSHPTPVHLDSRSPAEARAAYRHAARNEHLSPIRLHSPNRIASLAVASTLAAVHTAETHAGSPAAQPAKSPAASNPYEQLLASTRSAAASTAQHAETFHTQTNMPSARPPLRSSIETTLSVPRPPEYTPVPPASRKLEHMPLQTLLSMAATVPLGYGQYLRRAFETGKIDREGLVKVLKSRAKNRDFRHEYRKQVEHRRRLLSSPELSPASQPTNTTTPISPDQPAAQIPSDTTPTLVDRLFAPSSNTPTPPVPPQPLPPLARHMPWLIIALTCVGLLILAGLLWYILAQPTI